MTLRISHLLNQTTSVQNANIPNLGVKGIEACLEFYSAQVKHNFDIENEPNQELQQIMILLVNIDYLLNLITRSDIDEAYKTHFLVVIIRTYHEKLLPCLNKFASKRLSLATRCIECGYAHPGLPEYIYRVFDVINGKVSNFLQGFGK